MYLDVDHLHLARLQRRLQDAAGYGLSCTNKDEQAFCIVGVLASLMDDGIASARKRAKLGLPRYGPHGRYNA